MDWQTMQKVACNLLYDQARYLDERQWDQWLALYCDDGRYWVPAWKNELEATNDPQNEVSFIFYDNRAGLEDRIWRIRSGQSVASMPLPRTAHLVGNIQVEAVPEGLSTTATFITHVYYRNRRKQVEFFGRHEHLLVQKGLDWKILQRKTYLYNDNIPAVLDIYCI
jgi:3-phenylpropionate/cinnamic acid dioxygenase small subunit